MRAFWAAMGILVIVSGMAWGQTCTHWAAPSAQGTGDHSSEANAGLISGTWAKVSGGDTICLLDGLYQGASSMIVPTFQLSGSSGSPITIRAINDGEVAIDGENARSPVYLDENDWFVLEGFNAHDSSNWVITISDCDNVIARRIVAWNANVATNVHVWSVDSTNTLLEDVAGFGTGRKIFSYFQSNNVTYRRAWGQWQESTQIGPKMVFAPIYNDFNSSIENGISVWNTTQTGIDQPFGTISVDRIDGTNRDTFLKILGSISYVPAGNSFAPGQQFLITKIDEVLIQDSIAYFPSGEHSDRETFLLGNCQADHADPTACPSPNMNATDISSVGGNGVSISSDWTQTNVVSAATLAGVYGAESLFVNDGTKGATICYRYIDDVLTSIPLWPWPMNQRIIDAMTDAGETPVDVTATIESMFGTIPSICKATAVAFIANGGVDAVAGLTSMGFVANGTVDSVVGLTGLLGLSDGVVDTVAGLTSMGFIANGTIDSVATQ